MENKARMIWSFEKDHAKAADWLRGRGFPTRIYSRTLSAEGLSLVGYAVVTDAAAAATHPDYQLPGART